MKVLLAITLALLAAAPAAAAVKWSPPQVVARDAARSFEPHVAVNARGDALIGYRIDDAVVVVWRDRRGKVGRRQRLGQGLDPVFDVALADDGRGFAAWVVEQEEDDVTYDVMVAEAAPGERFGPPLKVEEVFGSIPGGVRVRTEAGRVVVAYDDGYGDIGVLARPTGGPFAPLVTFDDEGGVPEVAMNERGQAVVSWLSRRAHVAVRVRDGRVGERQRLANTGTAGYLRTGLGSRGGLLAAWQGNWEEHVPLDRHYGAIRAQATTAEGRALPPLYVDRAPDSERKGPQKPGLAVARDGSGVVVWQRVLRPKGVRYALRGRVFAARLGALGRRGRPRRLSGTGAIGTDARIATDRRGRSAAIWRQVPPESLSRPLRLAAATAGRRGRFGASRTVVRPGEKAELHALAAHDRGFLLAYTRRAGRYTATIAVRSGR